MTRATSFLTSTALSGLLVLLPLAILFIAGMEIYGLLEETAAFAALELPFPASVNALIFIALLLLGLFLLCLALGLFLKTGTGRRFGDFVEKGIAEKIPLLGLVRSLSAHIAGGRESSLRAVEVDLTGSGCTVLGFLMESLPDGRQVIFVPGAPAVTLGAVHIVPPGRVYPLGSSVASVANAISQWGMGTADLFPDAEPDHRG